MRKQDWMFWAMQQTLIFPLMLLSGMLLPLETGLASSTVLWGWVAALVTAAVGLTAGIRTMVHSTD